MTDKIEEIRARHQEGIRAGADEDRAFLLAEVEELKRQNKHLVRHNEWYLETLTEASLGRTEILAVIGTSLCVRWAKTFIDASMTEEDRRIIEKVMRQTSHADSDRERTEASREAERTLWFSRICAMRRAGIMVEETKP
jgi:hypothetical protein